MSTELVNEPKQDTTMVGMDQEGGNKVLQYQYERTS